MTPLSQLIDQNGRPLPLDRQLASGGEGAVFTIANDLNRVAKLYHRPPATQTIEKLRAMIAVVNPALLKIAAWPTGLLQDARTRQVVGFVMPRLVDCQPIQHLYNPVQRLRHFPRAGWTFQLRAALNLAAAFDEVHKAGCLVGDVNQSNAQVSPQALVRLIDCDSFQVNANRKTYLCDVGTVHYTPPELQGKALRGLARTENHDRFGLAVLIYQLLFVGRHPYAGVFRGAGDPSFEQLISEFRFAQGPLAHTWGMEPPPHTPTFADIPPNIGTLFRRAFERGSEGGTRPRPAEWLSPLRELEQKVKECATDAGHRYWNSLQQCTWCRLARNGGPEYYFGVAGDVATFVVDEAKIQEVLKRLQAAGVGELHYDRNRFKPGRPSVPRPLPDGLVDHGHIGAILGVATVLCALAMLLGVVQRYIGIVGFLGTALFGGWLAYHIWQSPWYREHRRRKAARNHAFQGLSQLEHEWQGRLHGYHRDHAQLSSTIQGLATDCRALTSQCQTELQKLTAKAEAAARDRHLRLHLLSDADIPKIGAGRKQVLAAHNILCAADIDWHRVHRISGFGDVLTRNLVNWKEEVIGSFRFNPTGAVSPQEQRSLAMQFRTRQQQFLAEADRQMAYLESLARGCREAIQQLIPAITRAVAVWEQASADLHRMNGKQ